MNILRTVYETKGWRLLNNFIDSSKPSIKVFFFSKRTSVFQCRLHIPKQTYEKLYSAIKKFNTKKTSGACAVTQRFAVFNCVDKTFCAFCVNVMPILVPGKLFKELKIDPKEKGKKQVLKTDIVFRYSRLIN